MTAIHVRQADDVTMEFMAAGIRHTVRFTGDGVQPAGEAQALVGTPAAMTLGVPVRPELPVAPGFIDNYHRAQALFARWYPEYRPVRLEADVADYSSSPPRTATLSFFTGGVDSFYSALTHRARLDGLVLVHGFDMKLESVDLRTRVSTSLCAAAAELGLPLREVETNLLETSEQYLMWGRHYHGMGLAAVAHLLRAGTVIIPSSFEYGALFPWGSHPDFDPLLGSDWTAIEHHGSELDRTQKVAAIASHAVVRDHLRVCFRNKDGAYNCGTCEKCVRTALNLASAGELENVKTLPDEIELSLVRSLNLRSHGAWVFSQENYRLLRQQPGNLALARALHQAQIRSRVAELIAPKLRWVGPLRRLSNRFLFRPGQ